MQHYMNKVALIALLSLAFIQPAWAQTGSENVTIQWTASEDGHELPNSNLVMQRYNDLRVPRYFVQRTVNSLQARARVSNTVYDGYDGSFAASELKKIQTTDVIVDQYVFSERGKFVLHVIIDPLRAGTASVQKLTKFNLTIVDVVPETDRLTQSDPNAKTLEKMEFVDNSVLQTGNWFKIGVNSESVYAITKQTMSDLGADVDALKFSNIRLYGQEGGPLPEPLAATGYDDLQELAIDIKDGNSNGKWDDGDLIIFYAHGPGKWTYNSSSGIYEYESNFASNWQYYFIRTDAPGGKRVNSLSSGQGTTSDGTLNHFDYVIHHEDDKYNFLQSGREWWGNSFKNNTQQVFSYDVPGIRSDLQGSIRHRITARSTVESDYRVRVNSTTVFADEIPDVSGDYQSRYHAVPITETNTFNISGDKIEVEYNYLKTSAEGDAWIDFFDLVVPRSFNYSDGVLRVFLREAFDLDRTRVEFNSGNYRIWRVDDFFNVQEQETFSDAEARVAIVNNGKNELKYMCFKDADLPKPQPVGKVENQDLHSIATPQFLIVTYPSFRSHAERLADFHRNQYGQSVEVVNTSDIFNEFGCGKGEPTAIRNFVKMLYARGDSGGTALEFLLLFGDGSYDYRDLIKSNTNYVPTFQSRNSYVPTASYSTDDFYGFLEDHVGYYDLNSAKEGLDISIGRIPATTSTEAELFVRKIEGYHSTNAFGDWRNRLTFVGDDEDNNAHFLDNEVVCAFILNQKKEYNVNKIYLDAYEQISFGSGQKYPEVNISIDKAFDQGHLIFNYLGHGGGSGLAHERVVTRDQIINWSNKDALPLVITATCELSRFDDPAEESPGELMLFDNDGGAIALLTTTRLVYLGDNADLNDQIFDHNLFQFDNGVKPTLGLTYMRTKNRSARNMSQRNFILLGDPAMQIAYPTFEVVTTSVNDSLVGQGPLDTMRAFEKVRVSGEVRYQRQLVNDFNGYVYPTVFDKFATYRTLENDPESNPMNYQMQNSVLYRGQVSVIDGKFSFQFVVPKDIAYEYGHGKISYYCEDGTNDGHGFIDTIYIGGAGEKVTDDDKGPEVKLYLNDVDFVFGGITGPEPLLIAELYDANGINTVGNGIGRDLLAIIDEGKPEERIVVLNDFYAAKLDSYQEGEIRYPMDELPPGKHTLKVKIWDVYNNSSEAYTEFVVAEDEDLKIEHTLNYPNPFTTNTTFHFDHNKVGRHIDVKLRIFSVAGNVVEELEYAGIAESGHFQNIEWDATDRYGDRLARGVYLYKVEVKCEDGTKNSAFEKLMLLK